MSPSLFGLDPIPHISIKACDLLGVLLCSSRTVFPVISICLEVSRVVDIFDVNMPQLPFSVAVDQTLMRVCVAD